MKQISTKSIKKQFKNNQKLMKTVIKHNSKINKTS